MSRNCGIAFGESIVETFLFQRQVAALLDRRGARHILEGDSPRPRRVSPSPSPNWQPMKPNATMLRTCCSQCANMPGLSAANAGLVGWLADSAPIVACVDLYNLRELAGHATKVRKVPRGNGKCASPMLRATRNRFMKVFVAYWHPEPRNSDAAMFDTARATLASAGHEVRMAGLHPMRFDPVSACPSDRPGASLVGAIARRG